MEIVLHMKGWAPRLASKTRPEVIRKWPIRDRSLITSQAGGRGGGGGFKKNVVFQNWTPPKNFEVKIIPPSQFLFEKCTPPPPLLTDRPTDRQTDMFIGSLIQ